MDNILYSILCNAGTGGEIKILFVVLITGMVLLAISQAVQSIWVNNLYLKQIENDSRFGVIADSLDFDASGNKWKMKECKEMRKTFADAVKEAAI